MKISDKTAESAKQMLVAALHPIKLPEQDWEQMQKKDLDPKEMTYFLMGYGMDEVKAKELAGSVQRMLQDKTREETRKMQLPDDSKPTTQMPTVGTVQAKPRTSEHKLFQWAVTAVITVAGVLLTVLIMSKCGNGNGKNANAATEQIGKDDLFNIEAILADIKGAVTAPDSEGNTITVMDTTRDIRVNMARKGDLAELAHKDDLDDLAKTSDLDGLATAKEVNKIKDDIRSHRKATENKAEDEAAHSPVKTEEPKVLEPARPTKSPGTVTVKVPKGAKVRSFYTVK